MSKITVIGSFVMDCVAKMNRFPDAGETVLGESVSYFMGGKGVNQCVSVSRLNGDVEMIGCVGDDAYGKGLLKLLKDEGISSEHVFVTSTPTAVAQIQINSAGENRICVIPAANYEFGEAHFEQIKSVIESTEIVMLQLELRLGVTQDIVRYAKKRGKTIILNPAPASSLDADVLGMIDIITPNETELALLTGISDLELAAKKLIKAGVQCVITTLGEQGARVTTAFESKIIPGFSVDVVDTVAAGDSFNGALAVALAEGEPIEKAVRFANAMGALTVQRRGAIPSLRHRLDVEAFLDAHEEE